MESIIKELWHGNIVPEDDCRERSPEMKKLTEQMGRHYCDLLKSMTDEQKVLLEKFDDCWWEYVSLTDESMFVYAFKLGMRIAIETLAK